jgi:hypothetical protein
MPNGEWGTVLSTTDETAIAGGMYALNPRLGVSGEFDKTLLGSVEITVDASHDNVYAVAMTARDQHWIEQVRFASIDGCPSVDALHSFTELPAGSNTLTAHVFDLLNRPAQFEETCLRSVGAESQGWGYCQASKPDCGRRLRRLLNESSRSRSLQQSGGDGRCFKGNGILLRARICNAL